MLTLWSSPHTGLEHRHGSWLSTLKGPPPSSSEPEGTRELVSNSIAEDSTLAGLEQLWAVKPGCVSSLGQWEINQRAINAYTENLPGKRVQEGKRWVCQQFPKLFSLEMSLESVSHKHANNPPTSYQRPNLQPRSITNINHFQLNRLAIVWIMIIKSPFVQRGS